MEHEKNEILESLFKSIQTFGSLAIEAECRDKLYRYNDAFMQSLYSILNDTEHDEAEKLAFFKVSVDQYADALNELFPKLVSGAAVRRPEIAEARVFGKSDPDRFDEIEEVEKFNPYHDSLGRFSTADGAASFTYAPGRSKAHDNAIAREKERHAKEEESKKPKRVEFSPAKTKKEAVEYAKSELGFTNVSYGTKLDIDTINHINEEIANIQARYPETKGACQALNTSSGNFYAAVYTTAEGSMTLKIGTKIYGNGMDYVKKAYESDVKAGFHPVGTDAGSVIWHEYGHVLATVSTKEKFGASPTGKIAANYGSMRDFAMSRNSNAVEKEWLFAAAKSTGKKPSEIMSAVSRYAQKNPAETFAESFAEVMTSSKPRAEALAVVEASGWKR